MNINRIIVTSNFDIIIKTSNNRLEKINLYRSEERRVGKEC